MTHISQHIAKGRGVAGHFQADIEAFVHSQLRLDLCEVLFAHIDRQGDSHFSREIEAVIIDVRDDHIARASVPHDGGGHDADGAGARDEHIFAEHRKGKGGVHRIAEWIKYGSDIAVDVVVVDPDVGHGQGEVFRKRARTVDPDTFGIRAEMPPAGQAVAAMATDHVAFAADDLTREKVFDVGANFYDLANKFVADHEGNRNCFTSPLVPFINMDIGPADAGAIDSDENVTDADFRFRDVFQPEARFGFSFNEGFH